MSAVAPRPSSLANSFYESDGRPSIDYGPFTDPNSKTRELVRAIGRQREDLVSAFRPPSNWTQRSSHHDVIWSGGQQHDQDAVDDQFSDAESWDGETQPNSNAATNADDDPTTSVYGHVRPTSIGSSIFAGRGARSERRRREVPPPLPNPAATNMLQPSNHYLGSGAAGLLSPSSQSMLSPRSDASGFDSSSQFSAYDGSSDPAERFDVSDGFDLQNGSRSTASAQAAHKHVVETAKQPLPSRNSSKAAPPLPVKAASRGNLESPPRRTGGTSDAGTSHTGAAATFRTSSNRLPDGTLRPKMPPIPQGSDTGRVRKPKARRDRSPVLSYDGGAAEEEKMLVELQDNLAGEARRVSTLGPKVKKNAPAPWELGGEDIATASGRPSLRDQLRPSAESFENPFSRFKSRPSVDAGQPVTKSPNPAHMPSGLALSSHPSNSESLEQEAQKENDPQSVFASQRSRSKSVSNSVLKGLGLAGAAAPASKKGKLTKALRLVGAVGGGPTQDERRPSYQASNPLPQPNTFTGFKHGQEHNAAPPVRFANELPQSISSRDLKRSASKDQDDLIQLIASSNNKFRDQARSPPLPSPTHGNGPIPSPRLGGVRSLAYKKDALSPGDTSSSGEHSLPLRSTEFARARTPPAREYSVASRSGTFSEDVAPRSSSLESESARESVTAEGESTPVGKASAEALASGPRPRSPSGRRTGTMSTSSSQTSGSLPLPGNIEGVAYKLISLEEAREQARQKQSEWLASSGDSAHDELTRQREPSSDGQSNLRLLKNKKSGFLLRKLKKDKGISVELDGVSTFPSSDSHKDLNRWGKPTTPSFSVTSLDEENDELKPLKSMDKPALQIRPVSSMFSGFAADFLDVSSLSEVGHGRDSSSSSAGSTGLLTPHSPTTQSFRSPSPVLLDASRFASGGSLNKPKLAEIKPTPHGAALPGPAVPGSADSNWSGLGGVSGRSRLPSLDAGASTDAQSQVQSPVHSPLTPTFQHTVHAPAAEHATPSPLTEDAATFSPPASPKIPDEARQRAREIEAQIQELCDELTELRVKHVGQGTAPTFRPSEVEDGGRGAVGDCPNCGCACAEQRRLQSINEAAVLKGISVLERGRALKPSSNMAKFGGYTNR